MGHAAGLAPAAGGEWVSSSTPTPSRPRAWPPPSSPSVLLPPRARSVAGCAACRTNAEQVVHVATLTTLVYRFGPLDGRPARRVGRVLVTVSASSPVAAISTDRRRHRSRWFECARRRRPAPAHRDRCGGSQRRIDATAIYACGVTPVAVDLGRRGPAIRPRRPTTPTWLAADVAVVWLAQAPARSADGRPAGPSPESSPSRLADATYLYPPGHDIPGLAHWVSPLADGPVVDRFDKAARSAHHGPGRGRTLRPRPPTTRFRQLVRQTHARSADLPNQLQKSTRQSMSMKRLRPSSREAPPPRRARHARRRPRGPGPHAQRDRVAQARELSAWRAKLAA